MFQQSHTVYVSAAHRYWNNLWSHERNLSVYGKSASETGLGNNLRVDLVVRSENAQRDFDFRPHLEFVKSVLDHKDLSVDIPDLSDQAATLERITVWMAHQVFQRTVEEGFSWAGLRVWETEALDCLVTLPEFTIELREKIGNLRLSLRGAIDSESGLLVERNRISATVQQLFQTHLKNNQTAEELSIWSERILKALHKEIIGLTQVAIDLSSHERLVIKP